MAEQQEIVIYNGARMVSHWPERIEQAQQQPTYRIDGRDLLRVRYGQERVDWGAEMRPCHDCRVQVGQFHVPACDVKECPNCGEQAITCDCGKDDDEDRAKRLGLTLIAADAKRRRSFLALQSGAAKLYRHIAPP